jgi:2'-5' RNA ligase
VLRAECGGRPTRPEKLHVTLAFLKSVTQAEFDAVGAAGGSVQASAFDLEIDQARYWKDNAIVWAGPSRAPREVAALSHELREALVRKCVFFDPQAFVAHVTLLRDAHRPQAWPVLPPVRWRVDRFCLVGSAGGRYEVLSSWPLG